MKTLKRIFPAILALIPVMAFGQTRDGLIGNAAFGAAFIKIRDLPTTPGAKLSLRIDDQQTGKIYSVPLTASEDGHAVARVDAPGLRAGRFGLAVWAEDGATTPTRIDIGGIEINDAAQYLDGLSFERKIAAIRATAGGSGSIALESLERVFREAGFAAWMADMGYATQQAARADEEVKRPRIEPVAVTPTPTPTPKPTPKPIEDGGGIRQ